MLTNEQKSMDKIVDLCKSRGFVYPGSEIYGGLANSWDYGPLGVELKNNIKRAWWKKFVQESPYNVGLDASIIMNPETWVASGHLGGFSDPLMDCKSCKTRHRADNLIEDFDGTNPAGWTNQQMMDYIREKQIPTVTARAGDVFPLGEGTLTVLGDGVAAENLNDISLVTLFEAPGLRCLSSGDGEKAVEDAVLASGADVHADVFKAAHHGSSTSNTQAFLDAVRPQAVVVSCGAGNSYGHPHSEALAAFANVGAQVYRTDTEGTIIAYVDKAGILQMAVSRQEAA